MARKTKIDPQNVNKNNNFNNCIYMYTNKTNNKKYIGQTKDFYIRHKRHLSSSYGKDGSTNTPFHQAIRKYGINNFEIEILIKNLKSQKEMNDYEIFFIEKHSTLSNYGWGYNIAGGGHTYPLLGKTDEEIKIIREKQSKSMQGRFKGKTVSDETRLKISLAHKGNKKTEEHRLKCSINARFRGVKGADHPLSKKFVRFTNLERPCNVAIYHSSNDAERENNKFSTSMIVAVSKYWHNPERYIEEKGRARKTCGGYHWMYLDDFLKKYSHINIQDMDEGGKNE